MNGVKTGHTRRRGLRAWSAPARRNGVELVSVVLGTPSEAARNADTLALLRCGFTRYSARHGRSPRARRGAAAGARPGPPRRRRPGAHGARRRAPRRAAARCGATGLPGGDRGPGRARDAGRASCVVTRRGRVVDRVPLVTGAAVARASLLAAHERPARRRSPALLLVGLVVGGAASLSAGRRRSRRRGTPGEERDRVIITVTLNAAIDKYARGARTSGSAAATARSSSARCRAARASTSPAALKTLGRPVIATGFAGGADRARASSSS